MILGGVAEGRGDDLAAHRVDDPRGRGGGAGLEAEPLARVNGVRSSKCGRRRAASGGSAVRRYACPSLTSTIFLLLLLSLILLSREGEFAHA
jgi:hypothetical protein